MEIGGCNRLQCEAINTSQQTNGLNMLWAEWNYSQMSQIAYPASFLIVRHILWALQMLTCFCCCCCCCCCWCYWCWYCWCKRPSPHTKALSHSCTPNICNAAFRALQAAAATVLKAPMPHNLWYWLACHNNSPFHCFQLLPVFIQGPHLCSFRVVPF